MAAQAEEVAQEEARHVANDKRLKHLAFLTAKDKDDERLRLKGIWDADKARRNRPVEITP